jgi:hypothetical protein
MQRLLSFLMLATLGLAFAAHPRAAAAAPMPSNPCATQSGSFKLLIDRAGIYELTIASLQAAGWSGTPNLARLHIYRGTCSAANEVTPERTANSLRFYAEPSESRYSRTAVYWVRQEASDAAPMATRSVTLGSASLQPTAAFRSEGRVAGSRLYDTLYPSEDGDHMFLGHFQANQTLEVTFTLDVSAAIADAQLRLELQGVTPGAHRVNVALGSRQLGQQQWSGPIARNVEIPIGAPPLAAGTHTLKLSIPAGPLDSVMLDRAFLSYTAQPSASAGPVFFTGVNAERQYQVSGFNGNSALLYDVRNPLKPVRLTNPTVGGGLVRWQDAPTAAARYALFAPNHVLQPTVLADKPSNLASGAADYVMVGHASVLAALEPLAAHYRANNMRVTLVDVQDVYDEFGNGEMHPEAIRSFLRYAYAQWTRPALKYVLLVGDGHYDFLNEMGFNTPNLIPPYFAPVDPWLGEAACDTCYGRLSTDNPLDQLVPDVMVGRFPVQNAAEATVLVNKTLAYVKNPPPGYWRSSALFLADNYREPDGTLDPAGDFAALSDAVVAELPSGIAKKRFYYDPTLRQGPNNTLSNLPPYYGEASVLRRDFFSSFDAGAGLVVYSGHASYWQWANTIIGSEPGWLWYLYDADARTNINRTPILLSLSCLTGYFQFPTLSSTDERLLLHARGGTVASISPSGRSLSTGHETFGKAVVKALYSSDPAQSTVGAAQLAGFRAIQATGKYSELLFTYLVLGDPALRMPDTRASALYLPLVAR